MKPGVSEAQELIHEKALQQLTEYESVAIGGPLVMGIVPTPEVLLVVVGTNKDEKQEAAVS